MLIFIVSNDHFHRTTTKSHCFKHVNTLLSVSLTDLLQSLVFVSASHNVLTVNDISMGYLLVNLGCSQLF